MPKNYLITSLTSCENLKLIKARVFNPDIALLFIPLCGRHRVAVARLGLVLAAPPVQRQRHVGVHGTRQLRRQPRHGRRRVAG